MVWAKNIMKHLNFSDVKTGFKTLDYSCQTHKLGNHRSVNTNQPRERRETVKLNLISIATASG